LYAVRHNLFLQKPNMNMLTLSEAAEKLEISRAALDNWIKRLGIEKKKEGRIGLTPREVDQIRRQRKSSRSRSTAKTTKRKPSQPTPAEAPTITAEPAVADPASSEQIKQLEAERVELQSKMQQMEWQREQLQQQNSSWETRYADAQQRLDWLQAQLDTSSREKTELLKQSGQFQQLLMQKEHSLQQILEEKQQLQQRLALAESTLQQRRAELPPPESAVEVSKNAEKTPDATPAEDLEPEDEADSVAPNQRTSSGLAVPPPIEWTPERRQQMRETLAKLNDVEARIITLYYGIDGERQTLSQIAEHLGMALEEVRQLAGRGTLKVRSHHLQNLSEDFGFTPHL
jgi:chromosome segregation ATPase